VVLKFNTSHRNVETGVQRHAQKSSRKKRTELSLEHKGQVFAENINM